MSYVLDALKRADAERERGAVPGLHAQPVPLLPADADTPRAGRPWLWLGLGLAIGLLTTFAWLIGDRESTPPIAAVPPQPVPAAPVAVAVAPPPITRLPAVAAAAAARPATKPIDTGASAAADSRVLTLQELPETVRRELPTLTIGGSIYSTDPAQRFLVINGRVVHEKEEIAPDLRLEQIKLKAAVLKYKDYRYTIAF
jgi:general secretion pathway protein B